MKQYSILTFLLAICFYAGAQKPADEKAFFETDSILPLEIRLDLGKLLKRKWKEGESFYGQVKLQWEGEEITEPIALEYRGKYRKRHCYMPPLKIDFRQPGSKLLAPLGDLKLVNVCELGRGSNREWIIKEWLAYKLYNLVTPKSFRVRLLKLSFIDSAGKAKPIEEYGFFIEDVKDMARRNGCVERKRPVGHTEATDRQQMTRVAVFEYMIANLDWSVPARHNIKLIVPREDTNGVPIAVPYDFDHSGFVKTEYAVPPPDFDIADVTVRRYQGFERTMEELNLVTAEFMAQKAAMFEVIARTDLLSSSTRKQLTGFLNNFFKIIEKPGDIKAEFIQNARKLDQ